jgi:hypothetical protein
MRLALSSQVNAVASKLAQDEEGHLYQLANSQGAFEAVRNPE